MNSDLIQTVERFPGRRVLLVGDFMLDRYVFADAEWISPEGPLPAFRVNVIGGVASAERGRR